MKAFLRHIFTAEHCSLCLPLQLSLLKLIPYSIFTLFGIYPPCLHLRYDHSLSKSLTPTL